MLSIPYFKQTQDYTCGPASLKMVMSYFGLQKSEAVLAKQARTSADFGTNRQSLARVARESGFNVYIKRDANILDIKKFLKADLPVIVNFVEPVEQARHFAVVCSVGSKVVLNDPANGQHFELTKNDFLRGWQRKGNWLLALSKKAA